ncbi:MAG: hypothetical protein GFH23_1086812n31 [Chloroflexi bacterium AL-N1]|nr:hypothetical protein [Chloroflexi bacterium AL-N1]NOK77374.1 hypothetical protein [Chloroflexi bacterium AL-N5]
MTRRYNSFLVRCWQRDSEGWHIDITHTQSGQRKQYSTWSPIADWMIDRCHEEPPRCKQRSSSGKS